MVYTPYAAMPETSYSCSTNLNQECIVILSGCIKIIKFSLLSTHFKWQSIIDMMMIIEIQQHFTSVAFIFT